jgi:hypothetical protein
MGTKRQRAVLDGVIKYVAARLTMVDYAKWLEQDLVIASGVIEGACRYVIGERMDCSGMRWVEGKAEAILYLRCIEANGLWEHFFDWCCERWAAQLERQEVVQIRTDQPLPLPEAA